ncbi:hypothetical protein F2Q69_00012692 [Brassica cretica]|uniref:Uncharacterized protein n=1 Tax=Brassica cretica TaxID=69181 RepID=A0A8S9QSW7_BRACR|nr:hypothetical protein F2Q69_00012692 [Brassica cretica]
METAKKHNRCFEDGKNTRGEEVKALGEEISSLMAKIKMLETENESKGKELKEEEGEIMEERLQDTDADTLATSLNKAAEKEEAMEVNTTIQ